MNLNVLLSGLKRTGIYLVDFNKGDNCYDFLFGPCTPIPV